MANLQDGYGSTIVPPYMVEVGEVQLRNSTQPSNEAATIMLVVDGGIFYRKNETDGRTPIDLALVEPTSFEAALLGYFDKNA